MSLSKEFSRHELDSLLRWDLPQVADNSGRCSMQSDGHNGRSTTMLTVEEIERMQQQAGDEAAERGWKEGYEKGLRLGKSQGYEQGYEKGQDEIRGRINELIGLLGTLNEPLRHLDEQVEQELVLLAMAATKQLVRRELKTDPGQVVAVVREAMQILPVASRNIHLYLHPEDAELVRSVLTVDDMTPNWGLSEDPLLTRGGCRIETDTSRIDATVEKRLAAVIATVLGDERSQD